MEEKTNVFLGAEREGKRRRSHYRERIFGVGINIDPCANARGGERGMQGPEKGTGHVGGGEEGEELDSLDNIARMANHHRRPPVQE